MIIRLKNKSCYEQVDVLQVMVQLQGLKLHDPQGSCLPMLHGKANSDEPYVQEDDQNSPHGITRRQLQAWGLVDDKGKVASQLVRDVMESSYCPYDGTFSSPISPNQSELPPTDQPEQK